MEERAGEHSPVVVRSTDFPSSPKAQVVMQIGRLAEHDGNALIPDESGVTERIQSMAVE